MLACPSGDARGSNPLLLAAGDLTHGKAQAGRACLPVYSADHALSTRNRNSCVSFSVVIFNIPSPALPAVRT